jgi:GNAT superfamily N-acetyltransferase
MTIRQVRFIISKLRYDSMHQIFLDALKIMHIRIYPFYVMREGLTVVPTDLQSKKVDGYEIGFADREDMRQLIDFADREYSLNILRKRLDDGDVCIAAWSGKKIIAFTWANLREFSFQNYRFPLKDHEAYLYNAYTASEHRGRGIAAPLRYHLYVSLLDQGRHTLFSVSERFNPPALHFKSKLGARIIASGVYFDLFGLWKICPPLYPERLRVMAKKIEEN